MSVDWAGVTQRVVLEACAPAPQDVVHYCGDDATAVLLAERVRRLERRPDLRDPPAGVSIVCLHGWLRHRSRDAQRQAVLDAARLLPPRGVLVVGDVMWSLPYDQVDEPEQYGEDVARAPTTAVLEGWAREAGLLPDLHRFGVGVGVLVAIKGER